MGSNNSDCPGRRLAITQPKHLSRVPTGSCLEDLSIHHFTERALRDGAQDRTRERARERQEWEEVRVCKSTRESARVSGECKRLQESKWESIRESARVSGECKRVQESKWESIRESAEEPCPQGLDYLSCPLGYRNGSVVKTGQNSTRSSNLGLSFS